MGVSTLERTPCQKPNDIIFYPLSHVPLKDPRYPDVLRPAGKSRRSPVLTYLVHTLLHAQGHLNLTETPIYIRAVFPRALESCRCGPEERRIPVQ
jgi:hypothetical protein